MTKNAPELQGKDVALFYADTTGNIGVQRLFLNNVKANLEARGAKVQYVVAGRDEELDLRLPELRSAGKDAVVYADMGCGIGSRAAEFARLIGNVGSPVVAVSNEANQMMTANGARVNQTYDAEAVAALVADAIADKAKSGFSRAAATTKKAAEN